MVIWHYRILVVGHDAGEDCLCGSLLVKVDNFISTDQIVMHVCTSFAVDGTFSQAALKGKIQIKEQLPKYFGGEVQLGESSCAVW